MAFHPATIRPFAWPRIAPLIIVILGALLYANTLNVPFTLDDQYYIVENPAVKDFRYYIDRDREDTAIAQEKLNPNFRTRKLPFFTFTLNYKLHGLRVAGYHVVNLLIHLICGLLVYWLVLATLQTPLFQGDPEIMPPGRLACLMALFTALFFIAHPVQTQAVTYISQRFTSLATLFYLLALLLFGRWRLTLANPDATLPFGRPALYGLALLAAVLAMYSKEISFTLPLVLIAYDWLFFGRPGRQNLLALFPFAATMLIIPALVFGEEEKSADVSRLFAALNGEKPGNEAISYLFTQFRVVVTYLRLLVLPINQNLDYEYPRYTSLFQSPVALSFLFLCLIVLTGVFLAIRSRKMPPAQAGWYRLTVFGIFWFFTTLSVESSIMPLGDLIFEHRLYLPSTGFLLALLGIAGMVRGRLRRAASHAMLCVLIAMLCALSVAAYARNSLWADPVALGEDNVRKSPGKPRPHQNLGIEFFARHRYAEARDQFETARGLGKKLDELLLSYRFLENFHQQQNNAELVMNNYSAWEESLNKELKTRPNDPMLLNEIGMFNWKRERWREAEAALLQAITIRNDYFGYYFNLAMVYLAQDKKDEGLAALREAARLSPYDESVQESLADELAAQEKHDEALSVYLKALDLNPGSVSLYTKIAGEHIRAGRLEEAGQVLHGGVEARADDPMARNDLGLFLERTGHPAEAEQAFLQALELNDRIPEVQMNLGLFYLGQGRYDNALAALTRAAQLDPANPDIHFAVGEAYTGKEKYQEAAGAYQQVLTLAPSYPEAGRRLQQVRQHLQGSTSRRASSRTTDQ